MGSDVKRYYVEMGGSVRDRRTEQNMGSREIRDRLNALEAQRDAALAIISNRDITYEQMVIELRNALGGGDE